MFRELRKSKKIMPIDKAKTILSNCEEGVLGTVGSDNYPYTVFLNYVYYNDKIYFHCANEGHKIDNINFNSNVSFSVVNRAVIDQAKFTTHFESVTCFGKAKLVQPSKEILMELIKKYSPDFLVSGKDYVSKGYLSTQIVEISVEHISGKESV